MGNIVQPIPSLNSDKFLFHFGLFWASTQQGRQHCRPAILKITVRRASLSRTRIWPGFPGSDENQNVEQWSYTGICFTIMLLILIVLIQYVTVLIKRMKSYLISFVWLFFDAVGLSMFPQIAFQRGYIITLVAFVWLFLHYALLNVSSNRLPEKDE